MATQTLTLNFLTITSATFKTNKGYFKLVGEKGEQGQLGPKGNDGAPFTYSMFTPEQLESPKVIGDKGDRGDKGDTGALGPAFTYSDFTEELLAGLKGAAFTYSDFTEELLLALKGPLGDSYEITSADYQAIADLVNLPDWVTDTKPTYTAAEVGALPSTTVIPAAYDDTNLNSRVETLEELIADVDTSWLDVDAKNFMLKCAPYVGQSSEWSTRRSDFVFCCIPDIHMGFDFVKSYHIPFLTKAEKLNGLCNLVVSSGDLLYGSDITKDSDDKVAAINGVKNLWTTKYKDMVSAFAAKGIAFLGGIGGHDFNLYNTANHTDFLRTHILSKEEQRACFISPCISAITEQLNTKFEVISPESSSACYYAVKDRFSGNYTIMLDETDHPWSFDENDCLKYNTYSTVCYSLELLNWLISILLLASEDSASSGKCKYIALHNHMGFVGSSADVAGTCAELKNIITAYINRQLYPGGSGSDDKGFSWATGPADFRLCQGMIVGLFKGHNHVLEYEKKDNLIHQIGSANPTQYPWTEKTYCYNLMYSGDVYVVRDLELRNLHFGRTAYKGGNDGVWHYNAYGDRWVSNPLVILNKAATPIVDDNVVITALKNAGCVFIESAVANYPDIEGTIANNKGLLFSVGSNNKGCSFRTGVIPEYTDSIQITFTTQELASQTHALFGSRSDGSSGNSCCVFLLEGRKLRADYPGSTSDTNRYILADNTTYTYTRSSTGDSLKSSNSATDGYDGNFKAWSGSYTSENYNPTIPVVLGSIVSNTTAYSNSSNLSNTTHYLNNVIVHSFAIIGSNLKYKHYFVACENNTFIDLVNNNTMEGDPLSWDNNLLYNTAPMTNC